MNLKYQNGTHCKNCGKIISWNNKSGYCYFHNKLTEEKKDEIINLLIEKIEESTTKQLEEALKFFKDLHKRG